MEKFNELKKNYDIFNGFLSADPEIKYFDSGKVVCKFSLPLKKDKDSETVWLNCETWNQVLAEHISEKYKKGNEMTVMGYLLETEYDNKKYIKFNVKVAM